MYRGADPHYCPCTICPLFITPRVTAWHNFGRGAVLMFICHQGGPEVKNVVHFGILIAQWNIHLSVWHLLSWASRWSPHVMPLWTLNGHTSMQSLWASQFLSTRYPSLLHGQRHYGMRTLPDTSGARSKIKVSGYQYRWLAGGYDLEIGQFQKWLAWWLPSG